METHFLLVDSGADYVLFPMAVMGRLGISRGQCVRRPISGVGGSGQAFFAPVELELLPNMNRTVRWTATVGFYPLPYPFGLFGMAGGLEFFQTIIDAMHDRFSLYPHAFTPVIARPPYTALPVP